jgi:hypothetical protein
VEIVLGVSMTPTTIRMVLVEGEKADGVIVDHDVFDITDIDGAATSSASDHVIAAVLGTQESAVAAGHHLVSTGVTWSDRAEAAVLREALTARGIDDVMLVSELHAAGALAEAVGHTVGYNRTALMFIEHDTATLSVVDTADSSIVQVLSRSLDSADAMAVLTEMVTSLEAHDARPEGMFVVGSGVDVTSVKWHLENLVAMPVSAPDQPELALARGAALASAHAPRFDASTVGLAYSQEPEDATTAGAAYPVGRAGDTSAAVGRGASLDAANVAPGSDNAEGGREPFLLVGSSLVAVFGVGVVALVISLAVSIWPTGDQRPGPGLSAVRPSTAAQAPPVIQNAQPANPRPLPETIPAPAPAAAPPTALQKALPALAALKEAPLSPAVLPHAPAPVGPPSAAPAPGGTSPVLLPAPIIQLPVPGLPPILILQPQTPQWPQPSPGHRGWERGDD